MNRMDKKRNKRKDKKKQRDITDGEEHELNKPKKDIVPDYTGKTDTGGDYVKYTTKEDNTSTVANDIAKDIEYNSMPAASFGIEDISNCINWNQMAVDTRKKRLVHGQTRKGVKEWHDFVKELLAGHYICMNCHRLHAMRTDRCYRCNAVTTSYLMPNKIKPKKLRYEIPKAFDYVHDLIEMPMAELEEIPGTRLKSTGKKLPGVNAYRKEIDELREPLVNLLNRYQNPMHFFKYLAEDPGRTSIFDPVHEVVTNYLNRLKLIRLQLWNDLYSTFGGLGTFKEIKKVTIDDKGKYTYIKVRTPKDAINYYPFIANHDLSCKKILILSETNNPLIDTLNDIESIKIGRKETIGSDISLPEKNPLFKPFLDAENALIFEKNSIISVIPQERSWIFPRNVEELKHLFELKHIESYGRSKHLKPSLREWDRDEID